MVKKTTLKTKTAAKKANTKLKQAEAGWIQPISRSTLHDFKTVLLLVSLAINFAVLLGWIILRMTTQYDMQVYDFLFNR